MQDVFEEFMASMNCFELLSLERVSCHPGPVLDQLRQLPRRAAPHDALRAAARHQASPGSIPTVSNLVSFTAIQRRPTRTRFIATCRPRTMADMAERTAADLESVWLIAVAHDRLASDGVTK